MMTTATVSVHLQWTSSYAEEATTLVEAVRLHYCGECSLADAGIGEHG